MITAEKTEANFKIQNSFWNIFQQFKFDLIYYSLHFSRCVKIIRTIKYVTLGATALATSVWMAWNHIRWVSIVCPIIILVLQVFTAVSDQFPFENRKLEIREMTTELDKLYIEMEANWRKIANGDLKESQIRKLISDYEIKRDEIEKHYFKNDSLPENAKLVDKATEKTHDYFETFI